MKLNVLQLVGVLAVLAAGTSHEMEGMDMDQSSQQLSAEAAHNGHGSGASDGASDAADLTPVPHVMHHKHGVPILQTDLLPVERLFWDEYNATNYVNYPDNNKPAFYLYTSLVTAGFMFLNPLLMVINNLNPVSGGYLVGLFVNSVILLVGLLNYSIFMGSIPDLYPNNVFNKFNWIYFFTIIGQFVFAVLKFGALKNCNNNLSYKHLESDFDSENVNSPTTLYDMTRDGSPDSFDLDGSRSDLPHDARTLSPSPDLEHSGTDMSVHLNYFKANSMAAFFNKLNSNSILSRTVNALGYYSVIIFNLLNWFNFLFFFVYVPTGVATFGLLGQGKTVFNLLAHFIKGGVFFMLGVLSLARYCGAFSNKGWAWNYKFVHDNSATGLTRWERLQPQGLVTMEWIESFLIFFYGSTNVFMEHLANPGGEWTAKDLEHVSIAFIFLGCGICGLITEKKLSDWRFNYSSQSSDSSRPVLKSSPGFSPNPFPILCIFWTGLLMSQHQQASELSTKIHAQWGNILVYGTAFRLLTYVMKLLTPKSNTQDLTEPSKPISELLAAFALLTGGLIFMESCDPVILAMEYKGFDAMFTLNLSLGSVFLLMAWIMAVFQFKNWYKKRYC